MIGDDTEGVQPWMQVPKGPVRDLVFAYEAILTEMRTWIASDVRIIEEWVGRLDQARDEFVRSVPEQGTRTAKDICPHGAWDARTNTCIWCGMEKDADQ